MQPARPSPRAPGSFSPLTASASAGADLNMSRPRLRRIETSPSDDSASLTVVKPRNQTSAHPASGGAPALSPSYSSFTSHSNGSASSLQNFSRPSLSTAVSAARSVAGTHSPSDTISRNGPSPLTLPPTSALSASSSSSTSAFGRGGHSRKHSQSAGLFEPTLPSTSTSNLTHIGMGQPSPKLNPAPRREMSASQIAAQAAVMHHQNQQQQALQQAQQLAQHQAQPYQQQQHARQRSQTVPVQGAEYELPQPSIKRGSGPLSPPILSLTEASAPRENAFGSQTYHNGLRGNHSLAAAAAANIAFPRSGQSSPGLPSQAQLPSAAPPPPPPPKAEKTKVKLFSRPSKISIKDSKEKPLPSPGKLAHPFASLQRGNFSTTSLDSTAQSFYSLANSSTATIRPADAPSAEKEGKEKEKKHHFLSRQKQKLKDEFHLPLSSASSNSKPTDPNAPSSLYNFNLPPSPGPNTTSFKSGLDLRHGGRALRDKKKEEKTFDDAASSFNAGGEWPGPSSVNSASGLLASSLYLNEPFDSGKFGLNNMTLDDAWPFLKAKLLVIFEAEDLRLPVEDLNRIVTMHIQYCLARRSPNIIVEDLKELLSTGFSSLDQTLRKTPEDRLIPSLVELWIFTFTGILPYMQAVFLPLDLEFSSHGPLMSADQTRGFGSGSIPGTKSPDNYGQGSNPSPQPPSHSTPEVRRIVLLAFRDIVILPRYETLKTMFSRLSLEFLPQSLASLALASPTAIPSPGFYNNQSLNQSLLSTSPSADSQASLNLGGPGSFGARPNTAMSLDPSLGSYNSTSTTLLGNDSSGSGNRSRAISNVSFGSDNTNSTRPFTPSSIHALGGGQNAEDSKQVTEMVGRMLQCMSVLASVGVAGTSDEDSIKNRMVEELNKLLKLNWLGRGRTGRNRRGIVGGRVRRAGTGGSGLG
ncbi:HbrB-like-domain-containing protein, partial [Podospora appendiculata]